MHNGSGKVTFGNSAEGQSKIFSGKALTGNYYLAGGFKLSEPDNGVYTVIADGTTEATLTVIPVGAASSFYSGTYQEMHTQLATLLGKQTAADVSYDLTLLKDSAYTVHKDLAMNTALAEGSYSRVTVDLNGYTLTASGMNNNLYTIKGTTTSTLVMTIDGANAVGKSGKLKCTDLSGALFFTRANDSLNINTIATAKNIELLYTNMAQGYGNENKYPNQPMMHLPAGKAVYLSNVKMTYTGEDAFAMEGKDLTQMYSSMIDANGVKELYIDGCEFIDTNTKGITTRGINVSGANTKVVIKNSKFSATYGVICSGANASVDIIDSDISGSKATYNGTGIIKVTDSVSRVPSGSELALDTKDSLFFIYGEGKNEIRSASALTGDYEIQTGYTLEAANGAYTMKEDTSVEATLCVNPYGGKPTFTAGNYQTLHDSVHGVTPSVPTTYTLVLNKDATFPSYQALKLNPNVTLKVDLNGHDFDVPLSGNIYQIVGSPNFILDGSDKNGKIGKLTSTGLSGAIVYPRNEGTNDDVVIYIHDIEMVYTNLAQGYADNGKYLNQPMCNLPIGDVTYQNVKVTYTGKDATAVEGSTGGSDITKMETAFISVTGNANLTVIDCEFINTDTKGINVRGINSTTKGTVTVSGTKIVARAGAKVASGCTITIEDSDVTGTNSVYEGAGTVKLKDTVTRVGEKIATTNVTLILQYGTGKTEVITQDGGEISGNYTVEEGYLLCMKAVGHYVVSDGEGFATVTMPKVFGNGMVFQRNKPINVYGDCATDGAKIKVTLDGISKTVTVANGKWSAVFDALPAKKGITLTVEQLDVELPVTIEYSNIDVGEVWLISGQSNANYEVHKMEDAHEFFANADNYDNIRLFAPSMKYSLYENSVGTGAWHKVTSELLKEDSAVYGDVSAIAYVMATRLAIELDGDVTIAIMDVNYNGSGIMTWIEEGIYRESFPDGDECLDRLDGYRDFYKQYGRYPASTAELASYVSNIYCMVATVNYNEQMAPLKGFGIKGVIWMQGEANSSLGYGYIDYYNALTKTFRMNFADSKLPIFVIQLHPFSDGSRNNMRPAQYDMVDADPYSYLVTAANCGTVLEDSDFVNNDGDTSLVHQSRKSPIGHRLADAVLKEIYLNPDYGKSVAPTVTKVEVSGNKIIVTFDTDVKTEVAGEEVEGFEIAGSDGEFVKANATVSGNKITVTADGVTAPAEVRYGFGYMLFELNDGTVVRYYRKNVIEYNGEHLTVKDIDGDEYTFVPNDERLVRTRFEGNVTNSSGHPLPIFCLEVGYTKTGG